MEFSTILRISSGKSDVDDLPRPWMRTNNRSMRYVRPGVGAVGGSALVDEYKIQDGIASKDLHAGDEVDFTAAQIGGVLTITKIQKK